MELCRQLKLKLEMLIQDFWYTDRWYVKEIAGSEKIAQNINDLYSEKEVQC